MADGLPAEYQGLIQPPGMSEAEHALQRMRGTEESQDAFNEKYQQKFPSDQAADDGPDPDAQARIDALLKLASAGGGGVPQFQPRPFVPLSSMDAQAEEERQRILSSPEWAKVSSDLEHRRRRILAMNLRPELRQQALDEMWSEAERRRNELAGPWSEMLQQRQQQAATPLGRRETIRSIQGERLVDEAEAGAAMQLSRQRENASAAQLYEQQVLEQAELDQRYEAEEARRGEFVDNALEQYKGALEDFRRAKPATLESYMAKRPGGMLLAGIALALGTFGSHLTGGPNTAMELISKGLDAEIRAQEQAIDQKRIYAGSKLNVVNQMRARLKDTRLARIAAKKALADQLLLEVTAGQKKGLAERAGIKGQAMVEDIGKLSYQLQVEMVDELMTTHEQNEAERYKQHQKMVGGIMASRAAAMKKLLAAGQVPVSEGEHLIFDPVSGQQYVVPANMNLKIDELRDLRTMIANRTTEDQQLSRAIQLVKQELARYAQVEGTDRREVAQRIAMVLNPYIKEITGAQMNESEAIRMQLAMTGIEKGRFEVLEELVGDQALMTGLSHFQEYRAQQFDGKIATFGAVPVQAQLGPHPKNPGQLIYYYRHGHAPRAKVKNEPTAPVVNEPTEPMKPQEPDTRDPINVRDIKRRHPVGKL